jgi:hypothetical protein
MPCKLNNFPPISRSIFVSLFLFRSREGGEEVMGVHARGCRFKQGRLLAFLHRGVTTEEAKRRALTGTINLCLHAPPTPRLTYPLHQEKW